MDKKEKTEKLYSAIGEIDEELINEACLPSIAILTPRFAKSLAAIAASILLISVSIPILTNILSNTGYTNGGNDMNNAGPSGGNSNSSVGSGQNLHFETDGATLTLIEKSSDFYTFELIITKEQEDINVTIRGEGENEYGENIFVISTTADFAELTHIPKAPPKIGVNGEPSDKIPTNIGQYTISIDLSSLDAKYNWNNHFTITPFGNIPK